jgi:transcriptional regulator with XRE-family HTH domain
MTVIRPASKPGPPPERHPVTCPSEPAQPAGAPLRRSLALTLRDLRRTRSLRLEDVATRLGIAPSTLSRIETGQAPARVSYVTIMLDIYGINDTEERAELIRLAAQSQHQPWWHDYDNLLTPGTGHYLDLEYAATTIRTFTARLIPDLLQTPAYRPTSCRPRSTASQPPPQHPASPSRSPAPHHP